MPAAPGSLVVRPILAEERSRFDQTLQVEHWLGAGLVGETMRYVALLDGEWCALVGFGSAALCVAAREALIGWSDSQRHQRLRYVTNNQRFCVLEAHRRPNLASQVLALVLARLSGDFERRWGHPVIAVETFTDPSRHLGTCYKASNFALVGYTSGYARRAGRFVHHGGQKAYWMRALRRDATRLLGLDFDHPAISERSSVSTPDLNRLDLSGLLEALGCIRDPRKPRGIRHQAAQVLAIATLATLRGATSLVAIGEVAASLPAEALERLGCFWSPSRKRRVAPEESTIRRLVKVIDGDELDRAVAAWMREQVRAGRLAPSEVPEVSFKTMIEEDDAEAGGADGGEDGEDGEGVTVLPAVAIDGKTLRGARLADKRQVHLLSALDIEHAVTIAQARVDEKTNEITVARPMLEPLDLAGVVVTADALHAQRELAKFLVEDKHAHYVLGLKGNQPSIAACAEDLFEGVADSYETHEKGHGRIEHRYYAVVEMPDAVRAEIDFPHAASFVRAYRERCDLNDVPIGTPETSYYLSDLSGEFAAPAAFAYYVRGHWSIENRTHYVRDRTFDEDRCQVRTGAAPQVLATLRNLAISVLRLAGFTNTAEGLRWVAWDYTRGLELLGL
ncbi:MAG: ISAs1 family transposase [Gaiellaceae bacterium]